jgi:hypothetical protein
VEQQTQLINSDAVYIINASMSNANETNSKVIAIAHT